MGMSFWAWLRFFGTRETAGESEAEPVKGMAGHGYF